MVDSKLEDHLHGTVSYELVEREGGTVLTVRQDGNASQAEADSMAASNWGPVLEGIKTVAEEGARGSVDGG